MTKIHINGQEREMTSAEETEFAETQTILTASKKARQAVDAQKAIDKASAKAKLIAGEALTEAEADTIVI